MARAFKRNEAFYKHALNVLRHGPDFVVKKVRDAAGRLRTKLTGSKKIAKGFDASDGYRLDDIDNWTPQQKGKVTRLFNMVDELTARPYQIRKPTSKKNLRKLQAASQHETFPKELKVAFVPVAKPEEKAEITFKKERVIFTQGGVSWESVFIDKHDIESNLEETVKQLQREHPAKSYKLMAGKYEFKYGVRNGGLLREFKKQKAKYNERDFDPSDPNSSYWGNWLHGVNAYRYEDTPTLRSFKKSKTVARSELSKTRDAEKKRIKRKIAATRAKKSKR